MPTLIGDGAHATDIWSTLRERSLWKRVGHHKNFRDDGGFYIIGINNSLTRVEIAAEIGRPDRKWVHPHAYRGPDCTIGEGTHINYGTTMTRTRIGEHCTIAPGVTICGDVVIGDRVFIGAGATILNLTTVEDDVYINAGAVIHGHIPAGAKIRA